MGCGCGGASSTSSNNKSIPYNNQSVEECDITETMLNKYMNIIVCLRQNNKGVQFGLTSINLNQLQGIVQSAINYPNDYCYYKIQLEDFKTRLLPQIIENAPECVV